MYIVATGRTPGTEVASGLAQLGARAAFLSDSVSGIATSFVEVETLFASRDGVCAAFNEAERTIGAADVVVHSGVPDVALRSVPIHELAIDEWRAAFHAAVTSTLYCFQAAHVHFKGRQGSIAVLGPSLSLVGASGLVPLTAALEAQRALAKSAARQWGRSGIRVNWIAMDASNYPMLDRAAIPQVPEFGPPPPPLGIIPKAAREVARIIYMLATDAARSLTGVTLNVDGGNWMIP